MKYRLEVEGISPAEAEFHPRAKRSLVNSYIRDKIKTLRAGKFGLDSPEPHQKCEEEADLENFMSQLQSEPDSIVYT